MKCLGCKVINTLAEYKKTRSVTSILNYRSAVSELNDRLVDVSKLRSSLCLQHGTEDGYDRVLASAMEAFDPENQKARIPKTWQPKREISNPKNALIPKS